MSIKQNSGGVDDPAVQSVAQHALSYVQDGARVGLGSGRASTAFIHALGGRVRDGLRVVGVPTSDESEKLAQRLNIPLVEITEDLELDLIVDGADEVTPQLDLIKGWGGALVRERIVTAISRQQIILVGEEKLVPQLGVRGRIPVEIIPLAKGYVWRKLKPLGLTPTIRLVKETGKPFISDNGNLTLDCAPAAPLSPAAARALESAVLQIAGVVDTGLFLGTASEVLVGRADGSVQVQQRK